MITVETDHTGRRTYRLPRALADVAVALFPGADQCHSIFKLAKALSWHDTHTVERIALNGSHDDAVAFARQRLEKFKLL